VDSGKESHHPAKTGYFQKRKKIMEKGEIERAGVSFTL
jgi:hypothetical protein